MAGNKTKITQASVDAFLDTVEHPVRRSDAKALDAMFRNITGWQPQMWGTSMIGYGSYHYTYDSGRSGDALATGFSPRKSNLSVYIMPGYANYSAILARLGKHKTGKSCLYINKLADIDTDVLAELIQAGLTDLRKKWPVQPS